MLQPIFDFVEKLASDFSWKKIVILIFLVFTIAISWFIYEAQTSTNQLAKYERTVAVLEKLEMLSASDAMSRKVVNNIYEGLYSVTKASSYQISFIDNLSLEARQAILAASPWLLFILFYVPGVFRGDVESRNSVWALIFLSLLIGGIGYLFPTKWGVWLYPLAGNFLFLSIMVAIGMRTKAKNRP